MTETAMQNRLGEVHACDCGGANLTLGPITIHLKPKEVASLHELVGVAMTLVEAASHKTRRTKVRPRPHGIFH